MRERSTKDRSDNLTPIFPNEPCFDAAVTVLSLRSGQSGSASLERPAEASAPPEGSAGVAHAHL